jgi:hypothetical protein
MRENAGKGKPGASETGESGEARSGNSVHESLFFQGLSAKK